MEIPDTQITLGTQDEEKQNNNNNTTQHRNLINE